MKYILRHKNQKRFILLALTFALLASMLLTPAYGMEAAAKSKKKATGKDVVKYAEKFVGNRYRWGGNSLKHGVDCSGFVVQVYKHFGVNLSGSRTSAALRHVGKRVKKKNIKKGDIVCYPHHVAIYRGHGKIVEAQSSRAGITKTRGVRMYKVITIRRVL